MWVKQNNGSKVLEFDEVRLTVRPTNGVWQWSTILQRRLSGNTAFSASLTGACAHQADATKAAITAGHQIHQFYSALYRGDNCKTARRDATLSGETETKCSILGGAGDCEN